MSVYITKSTTTPSKQAEKSQQSQSEKVQFVLVHIMYLYVRSSQLASQPCTPTKHRLAVSSFTIFRIWIEAQWAPSDRERQGDGKCRGRIIIVVYYGDYLQNSITRNGNPIRWSCLPVLALW